MSEEEVGNYSDALLELWRGGSGRKVVEDMADDEGGGGEIEGNYVEVDGEVGGELEDDGEEAGGVVEVGVVGGEVEEADGEVVDGVGDGGGGGDGGSPQDSLPAAWWTGHPRDCSCQFFDLTQDSWYSAVVVVAAHGVWVECRQ